MNAQKREAIVPREIVDRLLAVAGPDVVLVGGQALKFWVERYEVRMPPKLAFVSRDVDFLAPAATAADAVNRFARVLAGRPVFPPRRGALTALVGQAVRELSSDEVFNVDVLHRVFGADKRVHERAVTLVVGSVSFRVMHALDVLKSRLDNLYSLTEKQNDLGDAQLRAAVAVGRAFLLDPSARSDAPRPPTLRYARFIEALARSDAGRKVAARRHIHVADAIEPSAIPNEQFRHENLPRLARLMSVERRRALGLA